MQNSPKVDSNNSGDLPRKCVIIKRKKVTDDMEKVEMRYVAYCKVSQESHKSNAELIGDASTYLKERANEIDYQDQKNMKDDAQGKEKQKLSQCIPVLTTLRNRFNAIESDKNANPSIRKQCTTLKSLTEEIIEEAAIRLERNDMITPEFMNKIRNINTLARKILSDKSTIETFVADSGEMAISKSRTSMSRNM